MADVFISYSRQDSAISEALADYLKAEGYVVWWDPSLVAGERYREKIDKELTSARAIIVIWSPSSVGSEWVISEAEHGARSDNLITLRTPDVDETQVPRPFNTRHMDFANDYPAVRAALKRMAVEPLYKEDEHGLSPHDRYWSIIENSEHPEDFDSYLQEFPDGAHAALARLTVARLRRREPAAGTQQAPVAPQRSGSVAGTIAKLVAVGIVGAAGAGAGSYVFWDQKYLPDRQLAKQELASAINEVKAAQQASSERLEATLGSVRDGVAAAIADVKSAQQDEAKRSEILVKWAEEDKAWAKATTEGLIEYWQAYLKQWPSGRYFADAKRAIERRESANRLIPAAAFGNMARGGEIANIAAGLKEGKVIDAEEGVIKFGAHSLGYRDADTASADYDYVLYNGRQVVWSQRGYTRGSTFRVFTWEGVPILIVSAGARSAVFFDKNGALEKIIDHDASIFGAALSQDGKLVVAKTNRGQIFAWDLTGY